MRNERPFATGKSAVRGHGFHAFSETYAAVVTACVQPLFLPGLAHMTLHIMTCFAHVALHHFLVARLSLRSAHVMTGTMIHLGYCGNNCA